MFFHSGSNELNNHFIYPDWQLTSDHVPLTIIISIVKESINTTKCLITKDSKEKAFFIKEVTISVRSLNMSNLLDITSLDKVVNKFASAINNVWKKNSKIINIIKHSMSWWNEDCRRDLENYKSLKSLEDWKTFCQTVKNTKQLFFNLKIQEIANKKCGLWELMN